MLENVNPTDVLLLAFWAGIGWYAAALIVGLLEHFLFGDEDET
jgi:hypothetical protein